MTLQEQIEFAGELERLFLNKDREFSVDKLYEGEYRDLADKMGEITDSLWRLQGLEH